VISSAVKRVANLFLQRRRGSVNVTWTWTIFPTYSPHLRAWL